ncbi:MAG: response regulator [Magnetococcales bacterium]|nr:response regulator [Magnetococcales bacterium]MBF0323317.1 response regulator [Magnetococcales bacterium]
MAHILIVDDQPDIRAVLRLRLEYADHTVEEAENGREGMEKTLANAYDLVLFDMHMPVMDGSEAVVALRQQGYTGCIVAVTAGAISRDEPRAMFGGCDALIFKPVGEDFEERIDEILQKNGYGK